MIVQIEPSLLNEAGQEFLSQATQHVYNLLCMIANDINTSHPEYMDANSHDLTFDGYYTW